MPETVLGAVSTEERERRIEAAIHARMETMLQSYEDKMLGSFAEKIARFDMPNRSNVPEFVNQKGETVHRVTSPWDRHYRRLPKEEQEIRNPESDHQMLSWMRAVTYQDRAAAMLAEAKLEGMFPDMYRSDTLEGAASGVGGFAAGTGSYLLPRPLETLVAVNLARIAKMARWSRMYVMTAQEHNVPTAGAAVSYMQGEATSPLTGGEPALAQVALVAQNAIGRLILGRDLLDDQAANVVPIFVELMGESLAALEDQEFLRTGTGTAPHVTQLAGLTFNEAVSTSLGFTDINAMYAAVPQRYRDNARWLMAGNVLQYMRNVRDGNGRPLYQSLFDPPLPVGDDPGGQGSLFGKPVHEVNLTPGSLYFGDVYRNYAIGRRRGIQVEFSRDFMFDTRRVIWLVTERIAGNNIDTTAGVLCTGITSASTV